MGGIFGKEKKQSRITEQDQAILVSICQKKSKLKYFTGNRYLLFTLPTQLCNSVLISTAKPIKFIT